MSTISLMSIYEWQSIHCPNQISSCYGGLMDSEFSLYRSITNACESTYRYTASDGTYKVMEVIVISFLAFCNFFWILMAGCFTDWVYW